MLTDLDISTGKPADHAAIDPARVWTAVEDEEEMVEAMRLNERDVMMGEGSLFRA